MADDIIARLRVNAEGAPTKNGGHIWLSLSPSTSAEAADLIEAQQAEIERLRAAIDAVLAELGTDHQPNSDGRGCIWCFPRDGSWPCVHRLVLDELKEARRG